MSHSRNERFIHKPCPTALNVLARPSIGRQSTPTRLTISIPEDSGGVEDSSDMHYPPEAVQIRNTFIHIASPAAPECAYRAALSCPAAHVGLIQRTMKDWQDDVKPAEGKPVICLEDALCDDTGEWTAEPAAGHSGGLALPDAGPAARASNSGSA